MSGAATGQIAADVAWARPASIPADLILGYSGNARPDASQIAAWGKPFLLGFESDVVRSYAGYDAGIADANWFLGRAAEIGYPSTCGLWVCAADASSTAGVYWQGITDYFAAWRAVIGPARKMLCYGNRDAVEAAIRGGGANTIRWGVGTWGYGEGNSAYTMPRSSDADLLQSGNTPGPAEGTDYNTLYATLDVFAAFGGPAQAPQVLEDDDMTLYKTTDNGADTYYRDAGGYLVPMSPGEASVYLPGVQAGWVHVIPIGGWLAAVAFNKATQATHEKFPEVAVTLTDEQLAKISAGVKVGTLNIVGTATPR